MDTCRRNKCQREHAELLPLSMVSSKGASGAISGFIEDRKGMNMNYYPYRWLFYRNWKSALLMVSSKDTTEGRKRKQHKPRGICWAYHLQIKGCNLPPSRSSKYLFISFEIFCKLVNRNGSQEEFQQHCLQDVTNPKAGAPTKSTCPLRIRRMRRECPLCILRTHEGLCRGGKNVYVECRR